ncbi:MULTISPECIES: hypothetical protein [unclassified Thiocapsa]|uniref:hypothetical protein n=1 Tax=unclassified Thiocapsa TaxID=2641286 RepID=UPI0035AFEC66
MATRYPLILVDASGYLFSAYHALPKLTNSKGEAIGVRMGVVSMLRKLIDEHRPDYICVVFDEPGRTFRDEIYPDHKANRPAMADDLRERAIDRANGRVTCPRWVRARGRGSTGRHRDRRGSDRYHGLLHDRRSEHAVRCACCARGEHCMAGVSRSALPATA